MSGIGGTKAVVVAALAVAALALPARATTPASPSFTATTTVGSTVLPRSAASGAWRVETDRTATLDVSMPVHPSGATTHVEARWVSGFVRPRGGRCLGQYAFEYDNHRIVLPTPHVADFVRYRQQGGRWSRWIAEVDEDYVDTDPDMAVRVRSTDDCVFYFTGRVPPSRPVQLEIRHVGDYTGTHRITEQLSISVP